MWVLNGTPIAEGTPFKVGNEVKASSWWYSATEQQKEAVGLVWHQDDVPPDDRWYFYNPDPVEPWKLVVTPKPIDMIYTEKLRQLDTIHDRYELGGIIVNGNKVKTDEKAQGKITGAALAAYLAVASNQPYSIQWKCGEEWMTIDGETIIGMAQLIREHVQDCFDNHKAHMLAMKALRDADNWQALVDYDLDTGWPETAPPGE